MIQNTFMHIPKISRNKEIEIWKNGIHTWNDFLNSKIDLKNSDIIKHHLNESINALKNKKFEHFETLHPKEHWRLYPEMNVCFLDIETTGLSKHRDDITLIGMHSNDGTKIFMKDKNLDKFQNELKKYDMIVTFNGKCFDVPFIKNKYSTVCLPNYHVDLRFMLSSMGFRGGLKNVEKQFQIQRPNEISEVDGWEAVRLWRRYEKGDNDALTTLKGYLTADVENLKILMNISFKELKRKNFEELIKN